jgi:hypothetical protein
LVGEEFWGEKGMVEEHGFRVYLSLGIGGEG